MRAVRHRSERRDGSRWTTPSYGARRARRRRRNAIAKASRRRNR